MSAANPNPMEKSMVSVLVVANAGGGSPLPCGFARLTPGFLNFVLNVDSAITLRLDACMS
jgi:hypothetical protein